MTKYEELFSQATWALPPPKLEEAKGLELPGKPWLGEDGDEELDAPPPPPESAYLDYPDKDTRMIAGPIGDAVYPGFRVGTWREAKRRAQLLYGRLFQFYVFAGRWHARIQK